MRVSILFAIVHWLPCCETSHWVNAWLVGLSSNDLTLTMNMSCYCNSHLSCCIMIMQMHSSCAGTRRTLTNLANESSNMSMEVWLSVRQRCQESYPTYQGQWHAVQHARSLVVWLPQSASTKLRTLYACLQNVQFGCGWLQLVRLSKTHQPHLCHRLWDHPGIDQQSAPNTHPSRTVLDHATPTGWPACLDSTKQHTPFTNLLHTTHHFTINAALCILWLQTLD